MRNNIFHSLSYILFAMLLTSCDLIFLNKEKLDVSPVPQKVEKTGIIGFRLSPTATFFIDEYAEKGLSEKISRILLPLSGQQDNVLATSITNLFLDSTNLLLNTSFRLAEKDGDVSIRIKKGFSAWMYDDGYSLTVTNKGIVIVGNGAVGLSNAFNTLFQIVQNQNIDNNSGCVIPPVEIKDYPNFLPKRAVLIDISQGDSDVKLLKRVIERLSKYKIRHVHLVIADKSWAVKLGKYPKGDSLSSKHYSQSELIELIEYANMCMVEVTPQINLEQNMKETTHIIDNQLTDVIKSKLYILENHNIGYNYGVDEPDSVYISELNSIYPLHIDDGRLVLVDIPNIETLTDTYIEDLSDYIWSGKMIK